MTDGVGRINVDQTDPAQWIVEILGEHDISTAASLTDTLAGIFAQGTTIVIDLSEATFIDSSILGVLINAQHRADHDENEQLAVVAPHNGIPMRLIRMVAADDVLKLFETRAHALAALTK
jgi:anti-sigma B factor antagonist